MIENIYGQRLCVEFVHKIRDEADFVSVDALRERIAQDVVETRAFSQRTRDLTSNNDIFSCCKLCYSISVVCRSKGE